MVGRYNLKQNGKFQRRRRRRPTIYRTEPMRISVSSALAFTLVQFIFFARHALRSDRTSRPYTSICRSRTSRRARQRLLKMELLLATGTVRTDTIGIDFFILLNKFWPYNWVAGLLNTLRPPGYPGGHRIVASAHHVELQIVALAECLPHGRYPRWHSIPHFRYSASGAFERPPGRRSIDSPKIERHAGYINSYRQRGEHRSNWRSFFL